MGKASKVDFIALGAIRSSNSEKYAAEPSKADYSSFMS